MATGDIFVQTSSVTVTNTTTETTVIGTGIGQTTVASGFIYLATTMRFLVLGHMSTAAAVPGTFRVRIKIGSVTIADTGAQTLPANVTNGQLFLVAFCTCRTNGASGTVFSQGRITIPASVLTDANWPMVNTATSTIDTTASQTFDITVEYGTANASNTVTITNLHIRKEA